MDNTSLAITLGLNDVAVKDGLNNLVTQFSGIPAELNEALDEIRGFDRLQADIAATGEALKGAQGDMAALTEAMVQGAAEAVCPACGCRFISFPLANAAGRDRNILNFHEKNKNIFFIKNRK